VLTCALCSTGCAFVFQKDKNTGLGGWLREWGGWDKNSLSFFTSLYLV